MDAESVGSGCSIISTYALFLAGDFAEVRAALEVYVRAHVCSVFEQWRIDSLGVVVVVRLVGAA